MRSPQSLRNGETPSPHPRIPTPHHHHFHSTLSVQKLRRFNCLIFVFRLATFSFSLASSVFMLTNSRGPNSPRWFDFDAFRGKSSCSRRKFGRLQILLFVFAANAIVTVYSLFEMGASVWEISNNATLFPEALQVWFDFGHDQVFAYLLLSADSAGTALATTLREMGNTCTAENAFCVQSDISIGLGFAGFLFLGISSLLSGFRVVCFLINGARFHL